MPKTKLCTLYIINNRINENWVIKVADFGLSEVVTASKDYFRQRSDVSVKLPVKWMAPESLYDGIFSEKTDVQWYDIFAVHAFQINFNSNTAIVVLWSDLLGNLHCWHSSLSRSTPN